MISDLAVYVKVMVGERSCPSRLQGRKGRFTESGIGQMVRRRGRQAGLDLVHPHLLRKIFSMAIRPSASPPAVQ
jgi:hypothetical protein